MKKIILVFLIAFLLTGCTIKNEHYYDTIASTAISFFKSPNYEEKAIDKSDIKALKEFLSSLTHDGQIIDLTKYIDYDLPSSDTFEVCSVDYDTVKSEIVEYTLKHDDGFDPFYRSTCKGHYATVHQSDLYPDYEYTLKNPEHNYILVNKYKKDNIRAYIYKSTYNGKGLMLKLHMKNKTIEKIDTEYVNANDYIKN